MPPCDEASLDLLRDLLLEIASPLDCTILLLPSRDSRVTIALGGLDERSFLFIEETLREELADSIIPHSVELVRSALSPDGPTPQGAVLWKAPPR